MQWKWWLFTSVVVGALIALGVGAVDERDILWEGRTPLCPYCRAELPMHALVCRECTRSVDWRSRNEECTWCLQKEDVNHLRRVFDELVVEDEPLPPALADYDAGYFRAMDEGTCTYCGGLGSVLVGGAKVECPICRGDEKCVACGGDRVVVVGDEGAHRRALERADARRRAEERARLTDLPLDRELLLDEDVAALRGYVEAEQLTDTRGNKLLERARQRAEKAFDLLHREYERRKREPAVRDG